MDRNMKDLVETLNFIKNNMATKSDITDVTEDMAGIKQDVADIKETLDEHTRSLNIITEDLKTNLDKRLQPEVRVTNLEKRVRI